MRSLIKKFERKSTFLTAFEQREKEARSLFAAQYWYLSCLWMSLSSENRVYLFHLCRILRVLAALCCNLIRGINVVLLCLSQLMSKLHKNEKEQSKQVRALKCWHRVLIWTTFHMIWRVVSQTFQFEPSNWVYRHVQHQDILNCLLWC